MLEAQPSPPPSLPWAGGFFKKPNKTGCFQTFSATGADIEGNNRYISVGCGPPILDAWLSQYFGQ